MFKNLKYVTPLLVLAATIAVPGLAAAGSGDIAFGDELEDAYSQYLAGEFDGSARNTARSTGDDQLALAYGDELEDAYSQYLAGAWRAVGGRHNQRSGNFTVSQVDDHEDAYFQYLAGEFCVTGQSRVETALLK